MPEKVISIVRVIIRVHPSEHLWQLFCKGVIAMRMFTCTESPLHMPHYTCLASHWCISIVRVILRLMVRAHLWLVVWARGSTKQGRKPRSSCCAWVIYTTYSESPTSNGIKICCCRYWIHRTLSMWLRFSNWHGACKKSSLHLGCCFCNMPFPAGIASVR